MLRCFCRISLSKSLLRPVKRKASSFYQMTNNLNGLKSDILSLRTGLKYWTIWRRQLCAIKLQIGDDMKEYNSDMDKSSDLEGDIGDSDIVRGPNDPRISDLCRTLTRELYARFDLNHDEVNSILDVVRKNRYLFALTNLELLCHEGLQKDSLIYCPSILVLVQKSLEDNIKLLKTINGLKNINHFVPFLIKKPQRLRKLVKTINNDSINTSCGNRSYHMAQKLQLHPFLVNLYLAKRSFVLEMPWHFFQANLQCMIDFNVPSINILKDLWSFRYHPEVVKMRLQKGKRARMKSLKPWIVRCTEPILNKSLQISSDGFKILGDNGTSVEYIAKRLGYTKAETQAIMDKHPQVHTVRATKIKEVFDYLLDEAGFSPHEVANVPRILCHSLKTTKQRLTELKSYGCRPVSLVIVCRSKREYQRFLNHWKQSSGVFGKSQNTEDNEIRKNTTDQGI